MASKKSEAWDRVDDTTEQSPDGRFVVSRVRVGGPYTLTDTKTGKSEAYASAEEAKAAAK